MRERDVSGAVVATFEDYDIVRDLLEEALAEGIGASVSDQIRALVGAVTTLTDSVWNTSVTQRQIAEHLEVDPSVVSRNVERAVSEDYLTNDNPGQGRSAAIRIGERKISADKVLPALTDA